MTIPKIEFECPKLNIKRYAFSLTRWQTKSEMCSLHKMQTILFALEMQFGQVHDGIFLPIHLNIKRNQYLTNYFDQ